MRKRRLDVVGLATARQGPRCACDCTTLRGNDSWLWELDDGETDFDMSKPHRTTLLYMELRHPASAYELHELEAGRMVPWPKGEGLPLGEDKKKLMALLMAHGTRKEATLEIISTHLAALAKVAQHTEEEFFAMIHGILKEAEDAIPYATEE
ncbi:hypothetical protein FB451DRAFT_1391492 [Mycena latifolia]|nr:hypothetical protein FB451DRAFT_1391492 [Mycena latifolia]